MNRITHNLMQGSGLWHQHRQSHFNASDASAMMGASKYRTRAELIREKATGITAEVSEQQQRLYDRGHEAEALIRQQIEQQIGEDLYSTTMSAKVDGLPLSASLDGQTLTEETILECKLWNEDLAAQVRAGELAPHYYWQLEQQLLVSGAERAIFATGDGDERLETMEYRAVPGRAEQLIAGWHQFAKDLAAYQPEPAAAPAAVGRAPGSLPTLCVAVRGTVDLSNHIEFRELALTAIAAVNRDLQTDDDFATAELTVKSFKAGEDMLEATRQQILGQMADVNEVMRTIDEVQAELRRVRLDLDKLVTREKESRKTEIVQAGIDAVRQHYATINATLGEHAMSFPSTIPALVGGAIKGKRTIATIKDAADSAVAQAKIDASQVAERVRACIAVLGEFAEHAPLFADRVQLCATKAPDDLRNLARARVAEHQQREAERLEREREKIRQEEADKLAKQQAEADRIERERAQQTLAAGAPVAQQPLEDAANNAGVATGSRNAPPSESVTHGSLSPATSTAEPIALGQIKEWIYPLSIDAAGLSALGYNSVATKGAAKLYAANDFPHICHAMAKVLEMAVRKAGS